MSIASSTPQPVNRRATNPRVRGQSQTEFVLLVVLLAGAVFGAARVFGDQQRNGYERAAIALAGEDSAAEAIPGCNCGTSIGNPFRNCFVAGTKVLTADGPRVIEGVTLGDVVWSRDPATGASGWKPVTAVFETPGRAVVTLEVASAGDGTTETFEVTPNHPFWVAERGWVEAGSLAPGATVATANGSVQVRRVTEQSGGRTVYNTGKRPCPGGAGTSNPPLSEDEGLSSSDESSDESDGDSDEDFLPPESAGGKFGRTSFRPATKTAAWNAALGKAGALCQACTGAVAPTGQATRATTSTTTARRGRSESHRCGPTSSERVSSTRALRSLTSTTKAFGFSALPATSVIDTNRLTARPLRISGPFRSRPTHQVHQAPRHEALSPSRTSPP
jgi:Pretoxin HINT domain